VTSLYIALACLAIGIPAVLYALYRSKPIPESPPMRTADQRQIERETAEIQRNFLHTENSDGSNPGYPIDMQPDRTDKLIGWLQRWFSRIGIACAAIAAIYVVVPK